MTKYLPSTRLQGGGGPHGGGEHHNGQTPHHGQTDALAGERGVGGGEDAEPARRDEADMGGTVFSASTAESPSARQQFTSPSRQHSTSPSREQVASPSRRSPHQIEAPGAGSGLDVKITSQGATAGAVPSPHQMGVAGRGLDTTGQHLSRGDSMESGRGRGVDDETRGYKPFETTGETSGYEVFDDEPEGRTNKHQDKSGERRGVVFDQESESVGAHNLRDRRGVEVQNPNP